ncbi:hypothetical protein [Catenovulum sediminis]|uniref:Orphan protein n=1 Tax=Catenovulum sediminis TaxID=1740262 RepID=A0ABV1REG9_9ALTE|nr:hypothetical protein [Catenovulum sediminis]
MTKKNRLPEEQKLTVLCRVEPGSLGPTGLDYVEEYCQFAQSKIAPVESWLINWKIIPRYDKSLAETEYSIAGKRITNEQAAAYLEHFEKDLEEVENQLHEVISLLIDKFFADS